MTGPINFNPFMGVSGTENIEQIKDRRESLRFPELDLSPVDLSMNQGQDEDCEFTPENIDMKLDKQIPKQ